MSTKSLYRDSMSSIVNCSDPNKIYFGTAGSETNAIFNLKYDLPEFALHQILKTDEGKESFTKYHEELIQNGKDIGVAGHFLDSPTFRSCLTWAEKLGISKEDYATILRSAIEFGRPLIAKYNTDDFKVLQCALVGPAEDGYSGTDVSVEDSKKLHQFEVDIFDTEGVDFIAIVCMSSVNEALGIVKACQLRKVPAMVSFTVETDGKLPCGESLHEAIEAIDAASDSYPLCYQINCAHFDHFSNLFTPETRNSTWVKRIQGMSPNASRKSHAELDGCTELDAGDPIEYGRLFGQLKKKMPQLKFVSGCCGTDLRHLQSTAATIKALIEV